MNSDEDTLKEENARLKEQVEKMNAEIDSLKEKSLKENEADFDRLPKVLHHTFIMYWSDTLYKERTTGVFKVGDFDVSIGVSQIASDQVNVKTYLYGPTNIESVISHTNCVLIGYNLDEIKHKYSFIGSFFDVRGQTKISEFICEFPREARPREMHITISIIAVELENVQLNDDIVIGLDEKDITVNSGILMAWSEYFKAYFTSDMKEKAERRFPVKDVTVADFQEMLSIISPPNQSINSKNVEKMVELADRFLMPMLSRKCEIFLSAIISDNTFSMSKAHLFVFANQYNLGSVVALLLDRWSDASLFRSEFLMSDEYARLPPHIEQFINKRFVETAKKDWH